MSVFYTPELGQAIFGQQPQSYEASEMLDAALRYLRHELSRVLWNRLQQEADCPFGNTGATFDTEGLSVHAYSWVDDDQPWNLKCGDIEVSWYKYLSRGLSVNKPLTNDEVSQFLERALAIIRACDTSNGYGDAPKNQPFSYRGVMYGPLTTQEG